MPWITLDVEVAGFVEFKYTASGLEICNFYGLEPSGIHRQQRYVAFGETAIELNRMKAGDELRLTGYYKTYKWQDRACGEQSREDFIIRKWERIN